MIVSRWLNSIATERAILSRRVSRRRLWTGVCAHRWQSPTVRMVPSCQSGSRKSGRSVDSRCSTSGRRPAFKTNGGNFCDDDPRLTFIRITSSPIAARCWSAVYGPIIWRTVLPALPNPFSVKGHSHPFCARLAPSTIMWSSLAAGYSIRATELAAVRPHGTGARAGTALGC
jgi:hypothetical protein